MFNFYIVPPNCRCRRAVASCSRPAWASARWRWPACCTANRSAAPAAADPLALKQPHFPAKVKSIIWLFMTGGPSQVDTWDYKPELQKRDGQELAGADPKTGFFTTSGKCLKSPFEWKQHGESGSWVSDLFPHLSQHVDKMCFLHSMYLRQNNHAPASIELMCGTNRPGLPALGAWMTYGLGSQNQDLPSYVVMHDTRPRGDDQIWSAGFLPKTYQALSLDARRKEAIDNLARDAKHSRRPAAGAARPDPPVEPGARRQPAHAGRSGRADQLVRAGLSHANGRARGAGSRAARSAATHKLYGLDNPECATFARQCLIARRLVERGVRFVQIFAGKGVGGDGSVNDVPWDCHTDVQTNHRSCGLHTDQPAAALLADLARARLARIDAGDLGRRVRPHLRFARREGPRPQPQRLHDLDGRRRRERRASTTAPPTSSATRRSRTRSTSTTCTPRCCTCWAWSTPSSPTASTAATSA